MRQNKHIIKVAVRTPTCPLVHPNSYSMRTGGVYGAPSAKKTGGEERLRSQKYAVHPAKTETCARGLFEKRGCFLTIFPIFVR